METSLLETRKRLKQLLLRMVIEHNLLAELIHREKASPAHIQRIGEIEAGLDIVDAISSGIESRFFRSGDR